ncbi:MAG TPA: glycerophosphodiester phosphodiesterase [Gemmatimonadales bacterium]|nr:glycerophosphodiester phosphodiesterase [Gemmatimonadales bacterium]
MFVHIVDAGWEKPAMPLPLIIGHRGVSGHALENSLTAFRLATSPGRWQCDAVELDVHVTADGELVVHHDDQLSTGEVISTLTLDRLRRHSLADGFPPPTLREALDVLGDLTVFVEVKALPAAADATLIALIRPNGATFRRQVHSFDHRIIARLHRQAPDLSLGVLSCSRPLDPVGPVLQAGAAVLWQESHLIDQELVDQCQAHEVGVIAWTVNDPAEADALRAMGVMGLCGNWPERLRPASNRG